jgi:hypothetical protein
MAKRSNHYDAAFEGYLRSAGVPFVVVDEARLNQVSLKSMDFIVTAPGNRNLLVDVKGRQFPSGCGTQGARGGHKWENWATKDDIDSLLRWQDVFGEGFRAMLVFAYDLIESSATADLGGVLGSRGPFLFRDRSYAFFGVWADEYRTAMHTRSQSWETVSVRSHEYRDLRIPVAELLGC